MDKWQVIDDVLSWMPQIPSKEPAVIMAIVGIYKLAVSNSKLGLTKEEMANKALPFLIPLSIENGLTVQQFSIITSLIRDMLHRVETEHKTKLEQLHAIQDTQKSSLQMSLSENMTMSSKNLVPAPSDSDQSSMDTMFSSMGLNDYVNPDKSKLVNSVIGSDDKNSSSPVVQTAAVQKSSSTLSLQEKKQMMQNQQKPTVSPTPTNLTDSLINKSLSMNSMSSGSGNNWSKPSNSSIINSQTTLWNSSTSHNSNFNNQQSLSDFGSFNSAQSLNQIPRMGQSNNRQQNNKPDLSAFDNLLSPMSSQATQPMNKMSMGTGL